MLELRSVVVFRNDAIVLDQLSMQIMRGEIVSILGANGAGKTSLFEAILGFLPVAHGSIHFEKHGLQRLEPHEIAKLGIALVPEGRRLFPDMTVLENLQIGSFSFNSKIRKNKLDFIFSLFPRLSERLNQLGGTLSGGEQQMVAIGRALMLNPKLLIMDEASLGLSPKFTGVVFAALPTIRKEGVAVLLAEQNVALALNYSDRAYVMENGKLVQEGSAKILLADPKIRTAYLGL